MTKRLFYTYELRTPNSELNKAFTLIELMLVVIIIGVLAAMVMPRLVGRSEEARAAAAKADIEANIALALDMFEIDNGRYPATEEGLTALRTNPSALPKWKGPYLKKDPKDPWGKPYLYKFPGTHSNDYDLYSSGPNGLEGDNDDIGNW
jgi:general secretion pathway protein G